jgi:hypothetical protein
VAKGISSLNLREKWTILNQISKPCKGKPNSHAWNIQRLFRSNCLPFIPTRGTGPPQATVGPYAHQCAGHMSVGPWGNLLSHDTTHDPVHHPYSDCRIVNIQLLYRASDRKSLNFCQSY